MSSFTSLSQKLLQKSKEIFDSLDLTDESSQYFIDKCGEVSPEDLLKMRDSRPGFEGRTLLHNAALRGSLAAVNHLIKIGHQIDPIDSSLTKVTPLFDAIRSRNIEIAIVLVEAGSRLTHQDINGENALHYAARIGNTRMIKWLVKASLMSVEDIQECASATTIKLKLPEDLAINSLSRDTLEHFRKTGMHFSLFKKGKRL